MNKLVNLYQPSGQAELSPSTAILEPELIAVGDRIFRAIDSSNYLEVIVAPVKSEQSAGFDMKATLVTKGLDFIDRLYVSPQTDRDNSVIAWGFRYFLYSSEVQAWVEGLCGGTVCTHEKAIAQPSDRN